MHLVRDPGALITDLQGPATIRFTHDELDPGCGRCVIDRVAQDRGNRMLELIRVADRIMSGKLIAIEFIDSVGVFCSP